MAIPRVSLIMCVYNGGRYLRPAVLSALAQTYPQTELIVIDDGSTDGAVDECLDLLDGRATLRRTENQGRPRALNLAMEVMSGEYYAVLDADDLCEPTRVERQARALDADPSLAGVFCGFDIILNDRRMAPRSRSKGILECARDIENYTMPGHDPTAMYRVASVGDMRYESDLRFIEAFDYVLRVGERFPLAVLGECLYSYRVHTSSITKRDPLERDRMAHRAIQRARGRRGLPELDPPPARHHLSHRDRDNNLAAHFIESVLDLRSSGQWPAAFRAALGCSLLHPFDPHYQKAMAYCLLPGPAIRAVRPGFPYATGSKGDGE